MARYSKGSHKTVGSAIHRMKEGSLKSGTKGGRVKSRKQAIAIGLSEARKKGEKVPPARSAATGGARRGRKVAKAGVPRSRKSAKASVSRGRKSATARGSRGRKTATARSSRSRRAA